MLSTPAWPEVLNALYHPSACSSNEALARKSSPVLTNPRSASLSSMARVKGAGRIRLGWVRQLREEMSVSIDAAGYEKHPACIDLSCAGSRFEVAPDLRDLLTANANVGFHSAAVGHDQQIGRASCRERV